jgi:hypothetical protein
MCPTATATNLINIPVKLFRLCKGYKYGSTLSVAVFTEPSVSKEEIIN